MKGLSAFKAKLGTVNPNEIQINYDLNIMRFHGGTVEGVDVKDDYDIGTLLNQVIAVGHFTTPIKVTKRAGADPLVFEGHRRLLTGRKILGLGVAGIAALTGDAVKAEEIVAAAAKMPAFIYDEIPDADLIYLVNDQNQQQFSDSGVVRYIWNLQEKGMPFVEIACLTYNQVARFTSNGPKKLAELRLKTDENQKRDLLKTWLKGTLDDEILKAGKLGPVVRQIFMQKFLFRDQLTEKAPDIELNRAAIAKLAQAKAADGVNWTPSQGGPAFNMALEELKKPKESSGAKKPSTTEVKTVYDALQSKACRYGLAFSQGEPTASLDGLKNLDAMMTRMEIYSSDWPKLRVKIKNADVIEFGNMIFGTGDPKLAETEMAKWM